ncbi:GTP-binding protein [Bernardetia sp. ABR2-2B]|uniref:sulfate adenylyltransferase subunit 1 n=1 Tax=Bernardetia sp. ABR2-2B TaxID=3127472 RepID=UPI0030D42F1D
MDLLRFATAGSVDDGKSTLIGRLLYDTKSIFEDQLTAIEAASKRRGEEYVNLALLTDGLRAEREQGITIDVAYRYFATPTRKFILADCPGHIQYTRNMVTGASTAQLLVILIDARQGIVEQTRRHTFIAELLGIKNLVVCINKMDLVAYDEQVYDRIKTEFLDFVRKTRISEVNFIPISALKGDNVVEKSENMSWYKGTSFLYHLENAYIGNTWDFINSRFAVQHVIRPQSKEQELHDYRGYAGEVLGGVFKKGDKITVLPSGFSTTIKKLDSFDGEQERTFPPQNITMLLEDDIDISRGDMLVKADNKPNIGQDLEVMICWLGEQKLQPNGKYLLRHTTQEVKAIVKEIVYKVNINTLHRTENDLNIELNDIGRIRIRTAKPIFYDSYSKNKRTGSLILIDLQTNATVAAGMII